jgi:hypothetical protein
MIDDQDNDILHQIRRPPGGDEVSIPLINFINFS